MLEFLQATTYSTTRFVSFLRAYCERAPCLLCARIHRLYVHDYVGRLIRNPSTEKNEEIVVCVILCHNAKHAGRQYTKRMLPPFVTPECNITLENTVRMITAMPVGRIDYSIAATFLGTVCQKTIDHHYHMISLFTKSAVLLVAEYLARTSPFASPTIAPPYEETFALFFSLIQLICEAELERSGAHHDAPSAVLYLQPIYVFEKSRAPAISEKPLNWMASIRFYFDSS